MKNSIKNITSLKIIKEVKMKGSRWITIIASLFLFVSTAQANVKFGYVDVDKALLDTKAGKKVDATLKKAVEKKQKELKKKEADIEKMTKDFEKTKTLVSSETLNSKRQNIEEEMLKFQKFAGESQLEIQKQRNKLLKPLAAKMEKVIAEIAKKEGYTMIFRKSPQAILWASEKADLTQIVVKEFEKKKKKKKK